MLKEIQIIARKRSFLAEKEDAGKAFMTENYKEYSNNDNLPSFQSESFSYVKSILTNKVQLQMNLTTIQM